jgi:xanthine dehydrogenase YagS FAD-binding subunit
VREFDYVCVDDADTAFAALARGKNAHFLGGGTNLVDLMRLGVETPGSLVDVSRLPFASIEETDGGGLRIGAAVRNSDLAAHPLVRERYPLLAQALLSGASGQLRNVATTAGNLLQRTRCFYFMDADKPCNKRLPGSGCPAREGANRELAILGHSTACVATHPSDMAVALAALDAEVELLGQAGARTVPLVEFHRLPGDEPERDTVLEPGELITAVTLPALEWATQSTYRKVRDRASFSFAVASLAAALDARDGTVHDVRLALGGVAHKPWRAYAAEEELRGSPATRASFERAALAELAAAEPLSENGFKVTLARNLIVETLAGLVQAGNDAAGRPS